MLLAQLQIFYWTDSIYWCLRRHWLFLASKRFPWTSEIRWCPSYYYCRHISWSEQWSPHSLNTVPQISLLFVSFCCPGSSSSSLECSTQIFFISRRDKYLDFSEFINVLYCSLLTVMAAELVNAARSENDGEPERLRLEFVIVYTKSNVKIQCI